MINTKRGRAVPAPARGGDGPVTTSHSRPRLRAAALDVGGLASELARLTAAALCGRFPKGVSQCF